jgi:hypothetical protein
MGFKALGQVKTTSKTTNQCSGSKVGPYNFWRPCSGSVDFFYPDPDQYKKSNPKLKTYNKSFKV